MALVPLCCAVCGCGIWHKRQEILEAVVQANLNLRKSIGGVLENGLAPSRVYLLLKPEHPGDGAPRWTMSSLLVFNNVLRPS